MQRDITGTLLRSLLKKIKSLCDYIEKSYGRGDSCIHLRYVILPAVWKNHKRIEQKKQRKLDFVAEVLNESGRHTEAHVVRIIVKPTIERMNKHWKNMSIRDKIEYAGRTCLSENIGRKGEFV